LSSKKDQIRL